GPRTQIVPLLIGDPRLALRMCEAALSRGVFVQTIRPPTVASIASRLRLAVMASHRSEDLRGAARALGQAARAVGFDPRTRMAPPQEDLEHGSWEPAEPAVALHRAHRRAPRRRTIWGPPAHPAPSAPSAVFDYEAPDSVLVERAA
ncbi:MAG: hypothetical protein M3018_08520, partial [Actinomycetota bacterium]|nr:hypothetical protein [Actinomycetota bacterium]